ncbi:MAG TPA: 16S rRNA (adenine(1518)-N(6)/adenine(1519)-N(6))-dimethyltransferase RsmA [Burkholderiales bacterium]|nr:16S rRNA (adenine(1518)-N(6)/adenine(1519)-N(6))-dimethyltransferase RsmA [Burkholderiales bacterium]
MKGHIPRRRFGQNFLVDQGIINAIVQVIDPQPDDIMVEIGPGLGVLTAPLLQRLSHLHVIEIDRDLVARMQSRFKPEQLSIYSGDVLEFDFHTLPAPFRVVGNLPYNISTELLFRLQPHAARMHDAHFMLQKEVVERMVAAPSSAAYGRLSVMLQYRFAMEKLIDVPPESFKPAPKVDSAVVRMRPLALEQMNTCDEGLLAQVVTTAFTKRRKTLRNALEGVVGVDAWGVLGIDPQLRPENLSVADYVSIVRSLAEAPQAN